MKKLMVVLLAVSLFGNLYQFYDISVRDASEQKSSHNLIVSGGECQTIDDLQASAYGVLICLPGKRWVLAACNQKGMLGKDDSGMILACDGKYWQQANQSPIQNNVNGDNTYIER
jgi:glutamine amidotransferase PdxT